MKKLQIILSIKQLMVVVIPLLIYSCNHFCGDDMYCSQEELRKTFFGNNEGSLFAVFNGGFEESKNGKPLNWIIYGPETVPNADFKVVLDTEVFKEGKQSLRFDVKSCEQASGSKSPGFTNEFPEMGKFKEMKSYRLSFWVKNEGTDYIVSAGGVSAMGGNMEVLEREEQSVFDWKKMEYIVDVPKGKWLRMQLNIQKPGKVWIDDVRIEMIGQS
jgi:hypothetical protein